VAEDRDAVSGMDSTRERQGLEDQFFGPGEAGLLDELRRRSESERQRDALREVVKIKNPAFLDRLMALGLRPETAVALWVVPLVCVAWADGTPDTREQDAIRRAAQERGVATAEIVQRMLSVWLKHDPTPELLPRWKRYVAKLWDCFTPAEQWRMRENLLGSAREVAQASGSLLGLTSGISPQERAVLEDLGKALE